MENEKEQNKELHPVNPRFKIGDKYYYVHIDLFGVIILCRNLEHYQISNKELYCDIIPAKLCGKTEDEAILLAISELIKEKK